MGKDESCIDFVEDRPFNDRRYSIDISKIIAMGWKQNHTFDDGLGKTIKWYKENKGWWKNKINNNLNKK